MGIATTKVSPPSSAINILFTFSQFYLFQMSLKLKSLFSYVPFQIRDFEFGFDKGQRTKLVDEDENQWELRRKIGNSVRKKGGMQRQLGEGVKGTKLKLIQEDEGGTTTLLKIIDNDSG